MHTPHCDTIRRWSVGGRVRTPSPWCSVSTCWWSQAMLQNTRPQCWQGVGVAFAWCLSRRSARSNSWPHVANMSHFFPNCLQSSDNLTLGIVDFSNFFIIPSISIKLTFLFCLTSLMKSSADWSTLSQYLSSHPEFSFQMFPRLYNVFFFSFLFIRHAPSPLRINTQMNSGW